jgi:hypothetical protein
MSGGASHEDGCSNRKHGQKAHCEPLRRRSKEHRAGHQRTAIFMSPCGAH